MEFALRSCCNRDPSILNQSSVRGESGLGARAAVSKVVCCQQGGVLEVQRECGGSVLVQVGGGWIAIVNDIRCQVFMGMWIMHMGQKN